MLTLLVQLKTADPSVVTASCINWKPLNTNILLPADHAFTHEENDAAVTDSACRLLQERERLDILFVHLDDVDLAGHTYDYGPTIPEYVAALKKTDESVTSAHAYV
jgi:predicted AlkP superfamily pyrophosphatase or phosphodiesterase